jgi:hypothetical protein
MADQEKPTEPVQEQAASVTVNPETFLAIQMAQLDDQAADASVKIAEAELELAKVRKQRAAAILNYNVEQIKKVNQSPTAEPKSPAEPPTHGPLVKYPVEVTRAEPVVVETPRAERRRRRHKQ